MKKSYIYYIPKIDEIVLIHSKIEDEKCAYDIEMGEDVECFEFLRREDFIPICKL